MVNIRRHIDVAPALAQALAGLLELCAGIIQQDDALVALVARGIAPGPCAQFQQQAALGGSSRLSATASTASS